MGIMESLEAGGTTLFIDEDTCATNFMIRDAKMRKLVAPDKEPITAFVAKVRPLFEEHEVSTILVVGGTGDFFSVADTVIMMDEYRACDVTDKAKEIGENGVPAASPEATFGRITHRCLQGRGLAADGKVAARSLRCIQYGETEVELSGIEQLVETSQARAIGDALQRLGDGDLLDSRKSLADVVQQLEQVLQGDGRPMGEQGLDNLSRFREPCPFYVKPRSIEITAAVNRLRTANINVLDRQ